MWRARAWPRWSYNLEAIHVPTVVVHTKDDQVASHEASKHAAERIPGARFASLESGGHLPLKRFQSRSSLGAALIASSQLLSLEQGQPA